MTTNTLIEALRNPALHPGPVDAVALVETHISWVLFAGDTVYKLKKPLDLGFLDFTDLERRHFFCDEELRLNRRTAPELYLDVVPITGTPEAPRLGGDGQAIEYAVRMRRFDSSLGFDHLLADGRLERSHVKDLAGRLADLHRIADRAGPGSGYGRFAQVAEPMRDNFDTLASLSGRHDRDRLDRLRNWTEDRLDELRPLIDRRHAQGFVRECHGDAHLGNVTLYRGRATLFDCIEFSAELRWIDVINDLAFTVMDLRDRGAPGLSWLVLDEYLARTGDFEGIGLLPLYMVYRALVRAKVKALAREQADDDSTRADLDREIGNYLDLAAELAAERRPGLFITMGLSGSGKSWLAERLVERAGMVRVRSDVERKRLYGLAPDQDSGSALDADLYSAEATRRTYDHLAGVAGTIADAGFPAVVDATCLKRWQRDRLLEAADARRLAPGIIACSAPEQTLKTRIRERESRGEDASEAGLDVLARQRESVQPLDADERRNTIRVDTREEDAVDRAAAFVTARCPSGTPDPPD